MNRKAELFQNTMLFLLILFSCKEPLPSPPEGGTNSTSTGAAKGCQITNFWRPFSKGRTMITLSGTIEKAGSRDEEDSDENGLILFDLISSKKNQATFGYECSTTGGFSVPIPANLGKIWASVVMDTQGSGISEDDPHGRSIEIIVGNENISNLEITLQTETIIKEVFSINPPLDAANQLDPNQERVPDEPPPEENDGN